jgi:hypothetical protein
MVACPLIAQPPINDDKIGRLPYRSDLTRRRHAQEKLASGGEKLLGNQHGEGCTNSAADNAVAEPCIIEAVEVCVIAGPMRKTPPMIRGKDIAHHIAVGIEYANFWNAASFDALLPARLPQ